MGRILGLDFGLKRIGVALSDPTKLIATGVETYYREELQKDISHFSELISGNNVEKIVMGLPLETSGNEGEIALLAREFGKVLTENTGIETVFVDERFSSVEAEEMLKEAKMPWQERKKVIDKVAATIILQDYLNSLKK